MGFGKGEGFTEVALAKEMTTEYEISVYLATASVDAEETNPTVSVS